MRSQCIIKTLPSFKRSISNVSATDRNNIIQSIEGFREFINTGNKGAGLGFKKLRRNIYEFRVDIQMRIIAVYTDKAYYLACYGNHDDIERFLKNQ